MGGTGDTLAGIAAALLVKGLDPLRAAGVAAYINGRAGELAAAIKKDSLIATDVIDIIPQVIAS